MLAIKFATDAYTELKKIRAHESRAWEWSEQFVKKGVELPRTSYENGWSP